MPAHAVKAKRRLEDTPTKNRVSAQEVTPPKKTRSIPYRSPLSSPIRGPLQEDVDKNSPSFIAKCFYGLKKSQQSKENVPLRKETTSESDESSDKSGPMKTFKLANGKTYCPRSRLDMLMLERVAMSPVKQAVLETCTMLEFRKIYQDEYKEMEQDLAMENRRMTRRISKIITKKDDEDSTDGYLGDSSDDEVIFKTHNGVSGDDLRNDNNQNVNESSDIHRNDQQTPTVRNAPLMNGGFHKKAGPTKTNKYLNMDEAAETDESETDKESVTSKSSEKINGKVALQMSTPPTEIDNMATPKSSGRKFFKTRSPLDAAKSSNVVFGKGFNLKFFPKSPKPFDIKSKALKERKSKKTPTRRSRLSVTGKGPFLEKPFGGKESPALVPPSGFTFAPGFLTPEKNSSEIEAASTNVICDEDEDMEFHVNKSNCQTYVSPARVNTPLCPSTNESPCDSSNISHSDSKKSISEGCKVNNGELEDFFSSHESLQCNYNGRSDETVMRELSPAQKLFPIFSRKSTRLASSKSTVQASPKSQDSSLVLKTSKQLKDDGQSQMIIDAGQKKFGMTQCLVCSMVYCHADPTDESAHAKFHRRLTEALRFPGWKKERAVQEYAMDLGRVLLVLPDDPKHVQRKVEEVSQVMGRELGFADATPTRNNPFHKVFIYVTDKQIAGCCIAEPITEGFRIIPDYLDKNEESGQRPWCCAKVGEPACIGISRLWVASEHRKTGIATRLVDCVRQWFDYGTLTPKHKIAFSDPTPDGRKFAQKYIGAPTFLVYKYNHH